MLLCIRIVEFDRRAPETGVEACGAAASTAAAKPRATAAAATFCHHIRKWVQTIDSAAPAETAHTHKGLTPIAVPTVTTAASAFTHYIYF